MPFGKDELAQRIIKRASEGGRDITEAEAIAMANDNFFAGLYSHQTPSPQFDQKISDAVDEFLAAGDKS